MLKLYKRLATGELAYHEAWVEDDTVVEHWGVAGTRGETRSHALKSRPKNEEKAIRRVLATPLQQGFAPVDDDDARRLIIEYAVNGMGSPVDLEKRHAIESRMKETLGWTGLGDCDGGSIGSGSMEVCCFVVDFDVAKRVVEDDLRNTEFADYTRIYDEDAPG